MEFLRLLQQTCSDWTHLRTDTAVSVVRLYIGGKSHQPTNHDI